MQTSTNQETIAEGNPERILEIPFQSKAPIACMVKAKNDDSLSTDPSLIFTHGSGGTIRSPAMADFSDGFAKISPVLCFQGNMNLDSRTKMFTTVCEAQNVSQCLGGRSMGARAAVMASNHFETTHLVLVSYPLHAGQKVRDKILLDLPSTIKVIFVIGEDDSMCDLQRLENVREQMVCSTWLLTVRKADHGMNVKPKAGTRNVGLLTGKVVAEWIESPAESHRNAHMWWDSEKEEAQWSGWQAKGLKSESVDHPARKSPAKSGRKRIFDDTETKPGRRTRSRPSRS